MVLDAQTGEILALVNLPDFDPNQPGGADIALRRNRAVTDMIEPGSAMKPFPIAKALDSGKVNENMVFNTNTYNIGPATVRDTHNYPSLTLRGIMQKSSNVGVSKLSAMFKPEEMHDFYKSVGFGRRMHSGFPGESPGLVRDWRNWRPIEQATMSFGYGMQLSLLQLARAYTVLTTDGRLMPVSLEKLDAAPVGERILKPETAQAMRKIMVSVTEQGGTGRSGAVEGFNVAAKTGTAQKVIGRGYARDKHIGTFVGFAPAENPRVIVAVTIDEPRANGYYGGVVAGPVFKNIMSGSLNILGVRPNGASGSQKITGKTCTACFPRRLQQTSRLCCVQTQQGVCCIRTAAKSKRAIFSLPVRANMPTAAAISPPPSPTARLSCFGTTTARSNGIPSGMCPIRASKI